MGIASNTEPLFIEIGTGYRQDNLCWEILSNDKLETFLGQEKYNGLNYLQTQCTMRTIMRDVYVLAQGTWATFGRGKALQNMPYDQRDIILKYKTEGNDYSLMGVLGYQVNLTDGRHYKAFLTPLFGYAGYWKKLTKKLGQKPSIQQDDYIFEEQTQGNKLDDCWYGPIVGGDLLIEPGGNISCNFYYMFNWLKLNHTDYMKYRVINSVLDIDELIEEKVVAKGVHDRGQYGGFKLFCTATSHLNVNMEMQFRYFSSYKYQVKTFVYDTTLHDFVTTTTERRDKMIHWWWTFAALLEIAYVF